MLFKDESKAVIAAMQQMLDKTWKDKRTRDARLNKRTGKMERFKVVHVQRNENPKKWGEYFRLREELAAQLRRDKTCTPYVAKTCAEDAPGTCPVLERAKLMKDRRSPRHVRQDTSAPGVVELKDC